MSDSSMRVTVWIAQIVRNCSCCYLLLIGLRFNIKRCCGYRQSDVVAAAVVVAVHLFVYLHLFYNMYYACVFLGMTKFYIFKCYAKHRYMPMLFPNKNTYTHSTHTCTRANLGFVDFFAFFIFLSTQYCP